MLPYPLFRIRPLADSIHSNGWNRDRNRDDPRSPSRFIHLHEIFHDFHRPCVPSQVIGSPQQDNVAWLLLQDVAPKAQCHLPRKFTTNPTYLNLHCPSQPLLQEMPIRRLFSHWVLRGWGLESRCQTITETHDHHTH